MSYYNEQNLEGMEPAPRIILGTKELPTPINKDKPCYCVRFAPIGVPDWQYSEEITRSDIARRKRDLLKSQGRRASVIYWHTRTQKWIG